MSVTGIVIVPGKDNVAVVTDEVKAGDSVICSFPPDSVEITALEDIPIYHKISLKNMKKGEVVMKYGEGIGRVTRDVAAGGYIHTHNLGLMEE